MIEYLKPGEDIKFNAPAAAGGYREYLTTELQGIGAGVDVPYELLSGDLSLVNYSSYRAGMLGFRNAIEAFRWLTLIPMYCRPTWRRFIDTLVLIGKLPEANYSVQWTAPKFESVDPLKDAMAELKKIRTGTLTLPEAIAQNGYDPEKQLLEIKRVNELLDEYQIILDCDPRNVNDKGVEQPTSSGEATPGDSKPKPAVKASAEFSDSRLTRIYRS
jgi:capsid protein